MEVIRLKVKSGNHCKGGVKYAPGDEFDGTQAELNAFSDKLEKVESPTIITSVVPEEGKQDDSQLKVSIPNGKGKRRGRPRGSRNKSN
jgi:hypothetical protein